MKNIITFSLIIYFLSFGRFYSNAQEVMPDANFQILRLDYSLLEDGSVSLHYYHQLKHLSYFSFNRKYGETSINYNPKYQKIIINSAFTTMADGKVVKSPENAFNEVLPSNASDAPSYNYLRRFVVTHTALENNAVSEIDYTILTDKGFYPCLMNKIRLFQSSPVEKFIITIRIPSAKVLNFKLINKDVIPVISSSNGFTTYSWTFENLPAALPEPYLEDHALNEPYLEFSTSEMKPLYYEFSSQKAFKLYADEKMTKWVKEIHKNSPDQNDFIFSLQEKIVNGFRTYSIPLSWSGYKIQTPEDVFYEMGGTTLEKATLMSALFAVEGIKAFPVLVGTSSLVDEKIGCLDVFENVMIMINTPDGFIYLPVDKLVDQNLKYYLSAKTLVPIYTGVQTFEMKTEKKNSSSVNIEGVIKLHPEKESYGHLILTATNASNPWICFSKDKVQTASKLFNNLIPSGKENLVLSMNQEKLEMDFHPQVKSSSFFDLGTSVIWDIPVYNFGLKKLYDPSIYVGDYASIYIPSDYSENYSYKIKLSKGFYVDKKTLESKSCCSSSGVAYSEIIKGKGRKVNVNKFYTVKSGLVEIWKIDQALSGLQSTNYTKFDKIIILKK